MPPASSNIPGELKSNYIDLHESTGEPYASIAQRVRDAGGSETLADWIDGQEDTHERGRGDSAVPIDKEARKREAAVAREAEARKAAELKGGPVPGATPTPAASATGTPGRRTAKGD